MIEDPWDEKSPLDREAHGRLVQAKARYARLAGINPVWFWQPLGDHVSPKEVNWVRHYRKLRDHGVRGLLYTGTAAGVGDRMEAMCGALVRNFIDARVRPTSQAITRIRAVDEAPTWECSVLFLPDLCVGPGQQPDWFVREVAALLLERDRAGLQTVAYVRDRALVRKVYGDSVHELLSDGARYREIHE